MGSSDFTALRMAVEDGIATVTIDNPPINLIDRTLFRDLLAASEALAEDDAVRVVVLESALPDFFVAHFDIELILRFPRDGAAPAELSPFAVMCERFRTMPKATIAKLEGRVGGGGCELVMSCDMRFAALGHAVLNQPEVALGILPGGTGTQRLPRLLGRSRALEVVLGCDDFDAATAERYGWVNRALPPEELGPFVDRLARRIAAHPPAAVAEAKAALLRPETGVNDDLLAESAAFNRTLALDESHRRMRAFLDRGGQTPEAELRIAELAGNLDEPM